MLNQVDRPVPDHEAVLEYRDGDYRIVRPGSYVRCAVSGDPIPLDELRYWNIERQEAYKNPSAKLTRLLEGS